MKNAVRVLPAEVALLLVSVACMGCSSSPPKDEEMERSGSDDVPAPEGWTAIQLGLVRSAQLFPSMYDVHGVRMNVIGGRSRIVNGLDLGPGLNESHAAHGLQGGFSNQVETEGWGLQAGVANFVGRGHIDDRYSGLQVAGFSNSGSADGIQLAGFFNGILETAPGMPRSHGEIRGLQIAGLYNGAESVAGVQVAVFRNNSSEGFSGLQVGGINGVESRSDFGADGRGMCSGAQVGVMNAAVAKISKSVAGVQLAAPTAWFQLRSSRWLIGRTPSFEAFSGLQVGVINMVKSRRDIGAVGRGMWSGVQVGVVNKVDGGSGVQLGLWNSNPDGFLPDFPILNFSF